MFPFVRPSTDLLLRTLVMSDGITHPIRHPPTLCFRFLLNSGQRKEARENVSLSVEIFFTLCEYDNVFLLHIRISIFIFIICQFPFQQSLDEATEAWGIKVERVEM